MAEPYVWKRSDDFQDFVKLFFKKMRKTTKKNKKKSNFCSFLMCFN